MARQTRSGAQFSPYELDGLKLHLRPAETIVVDISVDSMVEEAIRAADLRAASFDNAVVSADLEWEDEPEIYSRRVSSFQLDSSTRLISSHPRSPSPLSSAPGSPAAVGPSTLSTSSFSRSPSPPSNPPAFTSPASPPAPPRLSHLGVEKSRRKARGANRRKELRQSRARKPYDHPRRLTRQDHRQQSPFSLDLDVEGLPPSSGACWVAGGKRAWGRMFSLPELMEEGCHLIKWNGRDPKLIVDRSGRIIAILLGRPEDPDWDTVVREAFKALHNARRAARRAGMWSPSHHRRGNYLPLTAGVSFGGGQKQPGNLANTKFFRQVIRKLLKNRYIRRLAGFQSSGLALYAPKVYRYYCSILKALFEHQPELVHNFTNSIFPAVTFNCGPDVVTVEHLDNLNLTHGFCGLTSGGQFDHTLGGHVHMRRFRIVIECPSGSSLLIPSGYADHGNTPIQPREVRHSMTQYAAGGLFRWVHYGHQSAKALLSQRGGAEKRAGFDGEPGSRWRWALDLLSKVDTLNADRTEVFGPK